MEKGDENMSNKTELKILKNHIHMDVEKNDQSMLTKHLNKYITIKAKQEKVYY